MVKVWKKHPPIGNSDYKRMVRGVNSIAKLEAKYEALHNKMLDKYCHNCICMKQNPDLDLECIDDEKCTCPVEILGQAVFSWGG